MTKNHEGGGPVRRRGTGLASRLAAALLLAGVATGALAFSTTFTGTSGSRSSSATFEIVGSDLKVTLSNISNADALVPVDILTGVFFDIVGDPTLIPASAVLAAGSTVLFPPSGDGTTGGTGDVGAEWAYRSGLGGAPQGAKQGISSSGLGLFGPGDRFDTVNNLQGPASPDGIQYGITTAGDNPATGNSKVTGSDALIKNSVEFVLAGLPSGFTLSDISNVSFQYGTSLSEPNVPGDGGDEPEEPSVPEPLTLYLVATGLVAAGWRRRRGPAPG